MEDKFPGFPSEGQYWQFPTIINGFIHHLNGNEFKVLWYILRHTYGYQKEQDDISVPQIMNGVKKKDGTILDRGTGIKWRQTVIHAIKKLVQMNFIGRKSGGERGKANTYYPIIKNIPPSEIPTPPPSEKHTPPPIGKTDPTINTNTIDNLINNDNTSVLSQAKPAIYGNGEINSLIDYLKEKLGLPMLDGSGKQNRRYCWLAIKKFGGVGKMKLLIDAVSQNDFWKTKITSFQSLYYKAVRIISETRKEGGAVDATQL
jgi:hypothetical protein